jgi:hypothetical protein
MIKDQVAHSLTQKEGDANGNSSGTNYPYRRVNNRYPDFKSKLSSTIGEAEANATFSKTQEVFAWLLTLKP